MPLVLRPCRTSNYEVIGEAFVHGLQYGEAIFGPLPTWWTRRYAGHWSSYEFVQQKTGRVTREDPRLRRFKKMFEKLKYEWRGTSPRYPTLTAERLQRCGVPVVDFDLV